MNMAWVKGQCVIHLMRNSLFRMLMGEGVKEVTREVIVVHG